MRYILAIDTAFAACNVAVMDVVRHVTVCRSVAMDRGQSEQLMPLIGVLLAESNLRYDQIDLVAVTVGPGSFTGIRVGIATARGLGLALNIPVQGVTTTSAIYAAQSQSGAAYVAVDTKRDDFYVQYFAGEGDVLLPSTPVEILSRDQVLALPETVLGDIDAPCLPDMAVVAGIAQKIHERPHHPQYHQASPLYAREAAISMPKRYARVPLDPVLGGKV